ncbi:MAG: VCBS repeat-containing protein, partial [Planctomycetota bacterium]|nr:VCBS repeat-containing protein [Planctomycetota bacterium]
MLNLGRAGRRYVPPATGKLSTIQVWRMGTILALALQAAIGCGARDWNSTATEPQPKTEIVVRQSDVDPVPRVAANTDRFESKSAIRFQYDSGRKSNANSILETVGGGVALIDFDVDGDLDVFLTAGGSIHVADKRIEGGSCRLYQNNGEWNFTDVTALVGLSDPIDYSHGAIVLDYNVDGFPDLFVSCFGRSRLLENDGGHFHDVTESSGAVVDGWSTAACAADFDGDGLPELFVVRYLDWSLSDHRVCGLDGQVDVCPPQSFPAAGDRLLHNEGDGRFTDITGKKQIRVDGKGLGVLAVDINQDGWLDVYVANDVMQNHLYLGTSDSRIPWTNTAFKAGVSANEYGVAEGSMGVDLGDYDGDGLGDLFVTNFEFEDNSLYRQREGSTFQHSTMLAGLGGRGRTLVGFGTGFVDFNLDGRLDLYVLNGHVLYRTGQAPYLQPSLVFRNEGGKRFRDVTATAAPWFSVPHAARGGAVGDLDDDGDPDLIIVCQD